jgi:hypothetical protein
VLCAPQVNDYRKLQKRLGLQPGDAPSAALPSLPRLEPDAVDDDDDGAEAEEAREPPPQQQQRRGADAGAEPRRAKQQQQGQQGKRYNALEALARKQASARDAAAAAAAAAEADARARAAGKAAAADARRRTAEAMRKRNARGQPVMRYRVDAILAKLQAEAGGAPLRR